MISVQCIFADDIKLDCQKYEEIEIKRIKKIKIAHNAFGLWIIIKKFLWKKYKWTFKKLLEKSIFINYYTYPRDISHKPVKLM